MAASNPVTPLLLTKRLNGFLQANQSPQLPTLLLTTSHGKLLAHASPQAVAVLRTHATVAASLLAIHTSSSASLPSALPGCSTPDPIASSPPAEETDDDYDNDTDAAGIHSQDEDETFRPSSQRRKAGKGPRERTTRLRTQNCVKPVTITVQLSQGTVIIRRLKCGLLFVCVGASAHEHQAEAKRPAEANDGAASDAESLISQGAQTTSSVDSATATSVVMMRKQAGELARWLDDRLNTLKVPEESFGIA